MTMEESLKLNWNFLVNLGFDLKYLEKNRKKLWIWEMGVQEMLTCIIDGVKEEYSTELTQNTIDSISSKISTIHSNLLSPEEAKKRWEKEMEWDEDELEEVDWLDIIIIQDKENNIEKISSEIHNDLNVQKAIQAKIEVRKNMNDRNSWKVWDLFQAKNEKNI